jgi:hypothetical protein
LARTIEALRAPLGEYDDPRAIFAAGGRRLDNDDLWTAEELVPLVYLPDQLAARLAWIGTDIRTTKVWFRELGEQPEPLSWDVVELLVRTNLYGLNKNLAEIQRVMVELINFQLEHGFEHAVPRHNPAYAADRN